MPAYAFSDRVAEKALFNKLAVKARKEKTEMKHGRSVDELMERLGLLRN
jgi:hypothetical protein